MIVPYCLFFFYETYEIIADYEIYAFLWLQTVHVFAYILYAITSDNLHLNLTCLGKLKNISHER